MKVRNLTNIISFSVAGLVVASVAFGWTNPSATPPEGSGAVSADAAGNVGIGTGASVSYKLNVAGKSRGTEICIGSDCRSSWPSGIGGSGTSGKLTKFTGATTIGNSNLTEGSTGNISIGGTPGSTYKLDVTGKINGTEICIVGVCKTSWPAGLTGSGTSGKIAKWTGPDSLGVSKLSEDASSVTITGDFAADGNVWGAQTNTQVGPNFAWPIQRWVNNDPWEIKCPNGQYVVGIAQVVISGYPGAKILCAKL
ncbi:MAG: Concanavalin A-like lectin/glucanases family protein [Parcubacteria group bacterium Gr01-1014_19]|nr:MAG: Concanavalin A-like lectin/glucanases family protein [Parcubacteria group bacterium Gr01-1014_19]